MTRECHVRFCVSPAGKFRRATRLAGSEQGAQNAAIVFSILGSCALCGVDPLEYLATIIPILARGVIEKDVINLLPRSFPAA